MISSSNGSNGGFIKFFYSIFILHDPYEVNLSSLQLSNIKLNTLIFEGGGRYIALLVKTDMNYLGLAEVF